MPMDTKRYPSDWEKIATEKKKAVGWKCEVCGKVWDQIDDGETRTENAQEGDRG